MWESLHREDLGYLIHAPPVAQAAEVPAPCAGIGTVTMLRL
ncbi:hypothetical protein [Rhodococcus globerulus]|nr:hypothetical protein [Rhodococcus globerulus]